MVHKILGNRQLILLCLIFIIPLGLLSKTYTGIGQDWMQNYAGDVLYEIFWCLLIFWLISPKIACSRLQHTTSKIALGVFLITCAIEISQLWFGLVPDVLKTSLIWRLLLGADFDWWDFPHYFLGSLMGWGLIYQIGRISIKN